MRTPMRHNWFRRVIEIITLILLMVLVMRIAVQNFHIQGQSMEPTLHDQEFILVDKAAYLFRPPARGDIIVFQFPLDPKESLVKPTFRTYFEKNLDF